MIFRSYFPMSVVLLTLTSHSCYFILSHIISLRPIVLLTLIFLIQYVLCLIFHISNVLLTKSFISNGLLTLIFLIPVVISLVMCLISLSSNVLLTLTSVVSYILAALMDISHIQCSTNFDILISFLLLTLISSISPVLSSLISLTDACLIYVSLLSDILWTFISRMKFSTIFHISYTFYDLGNFTYAIFYKLWCNFFSLLSLV